MTERSIAQHVAEILARTGIGKQLADENEANRSAQHAALRARKAAAISLFQKQKPTADALVAAADTKAENARKLADAALQEYISARTKLEAVYGTLTGAVDPIDKEMRTCYDPAIDAFKAELETLKSDCAHLFWVSADRTTDNSAAVNARVRALMEARDAADRLKIDHIVTDVPAALAAILATIPKA
jgi:hypothetical protein